MEAHIHSRYALKEIGDYLEIRRQPSYRAATSLELEPIWLFKSRLLA
jgi:hypothetical protein